MARFQIKNNDTHKFMSALSKYGEQARDMADRAIYDGAGCVADGLKYNVLNLKSEPQRYLTDGSKFSVVEDGLKEELIKKMGISTLRDAYDGWDRHIGWDGYGDDLKTSKYPKGRPLPMIAASIEIGSESRYKEPFIRKACNSTRTTALERMEKSVEESTKAVFSNQ